MNMNPLDRGLNLNCDISEDDGNILASAIIKYNHAKSEDCVTNIAFALYNISQYRTSGVGFSEEVSDEISGWIESVFNEEHKSAEKLADIVFELTSKKSNELVKRLYQTTTNEYLKATLLEVQSYKGI
jgi:hypothetical protein